MFVVVVVVVALLVVANHTIFSGEVGGGWGGVCTVIFMSNPTIVLRLCCRWGCDNFLS